MEVKYEDLVENPVESAKILARFLGIDSESMVDAVGRKEFSFETVIGQDKSGLVNMNSHSFTRLSAKDIDIVGREAGEMLEYYGYESPLTG